VIGAESNPENGFDSRDLNAVIQRLGAAGWLEGWNGVSMVKVVVRYSEVGARKMSALSDFFVPFRKNSPTAPSAADLEKLLIAIAKFAPELIKSPLSGREYQAFSELALAFKLSSNQPPDSPSDNSPAPPRF
jgi:hypothetical protein